MAEVTNTPWGEQHSYVLDRGETQGSVMSAQADKQLHVSPFHGMDQRYSWNVTEPGERLSVHIENRREGELLFDATLSMERRELTPRPLRRVLVRYPVMPLAVSARIYLNALKLKLKGVPWHAEPGPMIRRIVLRILARFEYGRIVDRRARRAAPRVRPRGLRPARRTSRSTTSASGRRCAAAAWAPREAYGEGWFECDDLVALVRIFALELRDVDHLRRYLIPVPAPGPAGAAQHQEGRPAAHRRPLRPRRPAVRAVPRRDDVLLQRGLRARRAPAWPRPSEEKIDRICRKLELTPDDHLVEIGSGWGRSRCTPPSATAAGSPPRRSPQAQYAATVERVARARARGPGRGPHGGLPRPRRASTASSSRSR